MSKTFRLWNQSAEPIEVKGDKIEFQRSKSGLGVKVFDGKKVKKFSGILALTEIMPPIIIERPKSIGVPQE